MDLKALLAKANEKKSGDELAGIAANSEEERVQAKRILAGVKLSTFRDSPLLPPEKDAVSRVIEEAIEEAAYREVKEWTVSDLREFLLRSSSTEIRRINGGLNSEMIAAVTKLMSNLDLVYAAHKLPVQALCNNTIGLPGRLGIRLQPNDPTDDPARILDSIRDGLSYGAGDAVIGVNPVIDNVENTARLLELVHGFIREERIPTQGCVLAHVTTQMEALRRGSPMDLIFQSLAGTEKALRSFGVTVQMLDEAQALVAERGTARGPDRMYFETGEGSELSADAHEGIDQLTLESRCYGLARRYRPFLLNSVVGFIGPEYLYDAPQVIRAGLEDHFMGKLQGISMGCDVCYTNHMDMDQNDLETLAVALTAAGCSYFMGVPMGDDCMLNYQTTSYHDGAALRELFGLRPAPEFEAWLQTRGGAR
ncbi:MAG: ethanolamine ammonia-lyase subunit EutB [Acidobacteria bacterium]|nr:ethanolamine ammonia-lyase subunit EutB [Acidobacteriota bacterium]